MFKNTSKNFILATALVAICAFVVVGYTADVLAFNSQQREVSTLEDRISISELEQLIEAQRNSPFDAGECVAAISELESLLTESIADGRDYVKLEDITNLGCTLTVDTSSFEDVIMVDTNDLGGSFDDVIMIDTNDLGGSNLSREELLNQTRNQLVESGVMTQEQANNLQSLSGH